MPLHVFRYKPVQGRLAPVITVGLRLDETWYPIGVYVDSGAAYTLLHADIARGAGFAYRGGSLIEKLPHPGGFFEVLDSPWIQELGKGEVHFLGQSRHFVVCCYDEILEVVAWEAAFHPAG